MTRLNSAIAIAALTMASSVTFVTALSLQRQPMQHRQVSSIRNRRATTTQWMLPNNLQTAFGQFRKRSSGFLPFRVTMEKPKDSSTNSSEEEGFEDEKAWVVPSPPSNPPPGAGIKDEGEVAAEHEEEDLLGEKIAREIINPLFVNPSIKQKVPSDVIQGAFINGSFLAFFFAYLIYGPFFPILQTIVAALTIGIITSYVSITEGSAGDFLRGVGKFTKDVTNLAVSQVDEWEESGKLDQVSKTVSKSIESGAKTLMDAAANESLGLDDNSVAVKTEEEEKAEEEAKAAAEAEAKMKAEEEAKAAAEAEAKRKAEEEEARLKEEARLAEFARLAEEARIKEEAEQRAAEQARLEEERLLEEQAEAAREAVRLMAEQEALMADDEEDDDDFIDDEDWEASVLLANELAGIGGESNEAKMMDELLQTEMGDLSEEEEDALGKAARAAVLKYEREMEERGVAGVIEEEEGEDDDNILTSATTPDYSSMTVVELKDILRSKGLKVSGKKAELIERLEESS